MKKIFYIVLAVLMLSACQTSWLDESKHPMPEGVGTKPEFVFDGETTITVNKLGGDYSASIKANQPWLVESTASWIVITSDRVGKGDGSTETVTFTVGKNPGIEPREAKIRMWITNDDEAYITVKQEPLLLEDLGNDYYVTPTGTGDGSSWAKATSLSNALAVAVDADKIHVAAGTYIPTDILPGGAAGDETFFVKANINLIGGYPANPKDGDVPDPAKNPTILSGNDVCYHCMVVGAPKSDLFTTKISGFTFTKGRAFSTASCININGGEVFRSYGAGMVITGGRQLIENCIITQNVSDKSNAGILLTGGAHTTFRNCKITENSGAGKANGIAIWNGPGAETYMYDCEISRNTSSGVGAIYCYDPRNKTDLPKILYMCNCEVVGNAMGSYGAVYARGSAAILVNCTIHGNTAANGAGVMSYGAGGAVTLISCTVTGNNSTKGAAGVMASGSGKAYINNSVVAGNLLNGADSDVDGVETPVKSVIGGGAEMFGAYANGVYPLLSGTGLTGGMTVDELKKVATNCDYPLIPKDVEVDAKGNKRTGTMMGAYVGK